MNRDSLQDIIQQLRPADGGDSARLEFYFAQEPNGFIRANQEGLRLFARELLQASLTLDYQSPSDNAQIPLTGSTLASSGEFRPYYLEQWQEPVASHEEPARPQPFWKQQLVKYGVWLGVLVFLFSAVIGFITFLRWIF
ncbi:hypothetical protein [Flaviaesturariibacter amylovorans]|uniref:Uncharacterized protein n=1 Tax=Flaviaesturariibacter amylovorans TaxID=1084520 RepID=A0ABP8HFY6_9BACT